MEDGDESRTRDGCEKARTQQVGPSECSPDTEVVDSDKMVVVTLPLSRAAAFYRSARFAGLKKLPDGVELTLSELQDMAARQQQQIESQQQMLVAKEQRLKFLKQQEMHQQPSPSENERLRRLREKVEAQELKLRKLRALRGQVDQQKMSNSNLTSELESIRALFNEKEKELSIAVAKVDELTQQLEELRRGRLNNQILGGNASTTVMELEKLRRELLYRNKLNEQQNNKLAQQREALSRGQEEMNRIDRRIAELQQRLHRKRLHNQQLANQINAATIAKQIQLRNNPSKNRLRPQSANVAAVESFEHNPQEIPKVPLTVQPGSQDDLHPKLTNVKSEDLPEFQPNKNDPKYQTLPVNTKFSLKFNKNELAVHMAHEPKIMEFKSNENIMTGKKSEEKSHDVSNANISNFSNGKVPSTQTVHSIPAYAPPKSHATPVSQQTSIHLSPQTKQNIVNLAPKPYVSSSYNVTLLNTPAMLANRTHAAMTGSPGTAAPKYVPPPAPPPPSNVAMSSSPSPSPSRETTNLPNTPLTTSVAEKSIPSVLPTSLQPSKNVINGSQTRGPSTIYQTSSTRIAPLTPHTLSTTPQGILREVEDLSGGVSNNVQAKVFCSVPVKTNVSVPSYSVGCSTPNGPNNVESYSSQGVVSGDIQEQNAIETSLIAKPTLPPKPAVPQKPTPPPRQIFASAGEKMKVDTSPDSVDSALNILRGNQNTKPNGHYRYGNRTTVAESYTQKLGNGLLNQYARNATHNVRNEDNGDSQVEHVLPTATNNEDGEMENSSKKPLCNDLPIKPKPLTIKKHSGVDPPKLKVISNGNSGAGSHRKPSPPIDSSGLPSSLPISTATATNVNNNNNTFESSEHPIANSSNVNSRMATSVHISINRRIEMPPAFLFPENEAPPPDLNTVARESMTSILTGEQGQSDFPDNASKIPLPPPPPLCPPPYPGIRIDKGREAKVTMESVANEIAMTENEPSEIIISEKMLDNDGVSNIQDVMKLPQPHTDVNGEKLQEYSKSDDGVKLGITNCINAEEESLSGSSSDGHPVNAAGMVRRAQKGNLKTKGSARSIRRVSFDPLALLLDASLEGELELVKKTAREVSNPSAANDEGITALHNAICAGHYEIVRFLVEFGCDVNAQDSDGWTPLHCAASCNNLPMVKFLVEHGACIFATTLSDHETAAEKCEEDEEGFDGCSEYLYSIQEKLGILNNGAVYALYDYEVQNTDEIGFKDGETIIVLRKGDEFEREWWWSRIKNKEGYIPRNLLGLYPRVPINKIQ